MIEIDYELSAPDSQMRVDPSAASDADLRYDFFLGKLLLHVNGVDLSARWGWIPLLDAAAGLSWIVRELQQGKQQSCFEFTEGEGRIQFECGSRGELCVASSYVSGRACVELGEFKAAVLDFSQRLLMDAFRKYPSLRHNTGLMGWYPPVAVHGRD